MPDFGALLSKPAGTAKKPPHLPAGDYPGVIKSYELGDSNRNKTPYVRFALGITGWAANVEPIDGVDLAKRQLRRDFYLTDDAMWRLDDLLRGLGIQGLGERSYEEVLPDAVGAQVVIEVQERLNERANPPEMFNDVGKVIGA